MGCCSALNCSNSSEKNFRMFRFPSDQERRKKWIENSRREGWTPGPNAQLCSVHFEESQFELHRQDGWKKLKPNAIPTLFPEPAVPKLKRVKGSSKRKRSPSEESEVSPKRKSVRKKSSQESSSKKKKLKKGLRSKSRVVQKKKHASLENSQNDGQKKKQGSSDSSQTSQKENVSPRLRKSQRPRKIATPPVSVHFEESQFLTNWKYGGMKLKPTAIPTLFPTSEKNSNSKERLAYSPDDVSPLSAEYSSQPFGTPNKTLVIMEFTQSPTDEKEELGLLNNAEDSKNGPSAPHMLLEGECVPHMSLERECDSLRKQVRLDSDGREFNVASWNGWEPMGYMLPDGTAPQTSPVFMLTSDEIKQEPPDPPSFNMNDYLLHEVLSLKNENSALSSVNESLKERMKDLENHSDEMVKENESMLSEIQEFVSNNKNMSKVILELEKQNNALNDRLKKIRKRKRKMFKKIRRLVKRNKVLSDKVKHSFSEEQLPQLNKLKALGTIERYMPD